MLDHLLIAYNGIVVFISLFSLILIFIGIPQKHYLKNYFYTHLSFTLIFNLLLLKSYVYVNIPNSSNIFIIANIGLAVILQNILLYFGTTTFYSLFKTSPIPKKIIAIFLALVGIITLTPISIVVDLENIRVTFGVAYLPISIVYVALIFYLIVLCINNIKKVKNKQDRTFAKLSIIFISTGFLESLANVIFISKNDILDINITDPEIMFSSIPHLIIGIYLSLMIFKGILNKGNPTQDDIMALGFSPRETELIELILKGYTNNQISDELSISVSTVKTHINNIFKKADVTSRFELLKVIKK